MLLKIISNIRKINFIFNIIIFIYYYFGSVFYLWSKLFNKPYIESYLFSNQEAGRNRQSIIKDILKKIKKKKIEILEVSVFCGQTTLGLIDLFNILNIKYKITCVDIWDTFYIPSDNFMPDDNFHHLKMSKDLKNEKIFNLFIHNIRSLNAEKKIYIKKMDSKFFFKKNKKKFDLIIIDGSHAFEVVDNDLKNAKKYLNNDGFIIGDDYELSPSKINLTELKKLAKFEKDRFFHKKTKIDFHPGVTLAVKKNLGNLSTKNGLFCVQKKINSFVDIFI